MISNFQFSKPSLLSIEYRAGVDCDSPKSFDIVNNFNVKINRNESEPTAFVSLVFNISTEAENLPFFINAEIGAYFKWDDTFSDDEISSLLNKNAPALLLSYLRPIVSNLTSAGNHAAYDIPFMNFTEGVE